MLTSLDEFRTVQIMSRHHGHDHGHIEPPEVVNIDDGVFAYIQPDGSWWINNCGILANGGDTVIVDTCSTERRTNLFLETVERLDSGPIRAVVNTHHHGDHTHGNWLTKPAAIIGHRRCQVRARLLHVVARDRD